MFQTQIRTDFLNLGVVESSIYITGPSSMSSFGLSVPGVIGHVTDRVSSVELSVTCLYTYYRPDSTSSSVTTKMMLRNVEALVSEGKVFNRYHKLKGTGYNTNSN